jgi:hypothetical protein
MATSHQAPPARIAETAPLFASMLSIPTGVRYPPLALSAAQQRRLTLAALLDQLEALARQKPVLMPSGRNSDQHQYRQGADALDGQIEHFERSRIGPVGVLEQRRWERASAAW